jgi:hypothetical protein
MGDYASRNDAFVLFQNGQIDGQFAWIDTYLNSTWLNNALCRFRSFPVLK